jgi:periplasmic protein TonB
MKRRFRFTIYHGFAASLALHAALALPVAVYGLAPDDESEPLVVELRGVVADDQSDEKVLEQTKSERPTETETPPTETAAAPPPPDEPPPPQQQAVDDGELPPPPEQTPPPPPPKPEQKVANADQKTVIGVDQQQVARRIQLSERELLNIYVQALSKKVQAHLVYPEDGRRAGLKGIATVSFAILSNGHIRPETLKIAESSGQPKLDESALKTVRASVPFAPPPREMTIAIAVDFGPKR